MIVIDFQDLGAVTSLCVSMSVSFNSSVDSPASADPVNWEQYPVHLRLLFSTSSWLCDGKAWTVEIHALRDIRTHCPWVTAFQGRETSRNDVPLPN